MNTYFDVTPEDLGRLTPSEAVIVFRDLVFAEAKLIGGVDLGKIDIPSSSNAIVTRDGGIDGQVADANPKQKSHGIIKPGLTCYQVKTGSVNVNTADKAIKVNRFFLKKKDFLRLSALSTHLYFKHIRNPSGDIRLSPGGP